MERVSRLELAAALSTVAKPRPLPAAPEARRGDAGRAARMVWVQRLEGLPALGAYLRERPEPATSRDRRGVLPSPAASRGARALSAPRTPPVARAPIRREVVELANDAAVAALFDISRIPSREGTEGVGRRSAGRADPTPRLATPGTRRRKNRPGQRVDGAIVGPCRPLLPAGTLGGGSSTRSRTSHSPVGKVEADRFGPFQLGPRASFFPAPDPHALPIYLGGA